MEQVNETEGYTIPDNKGKALASFVLGLVSIVTWLIPYIGVPVSIVGIIMGILGIKSSRKTKAIVGIVLCSVFLIVSVIAIILVVANMDTITEILNSRNM